MEFNGKIRATTKLCDTLREWLDDLMRTDEICHFLEERSYALQSVFEDMAPYAYYFKKHDLTTEEFSQLAERIVKEFCGAFSPQDVRMFMANSADVLTDDGKAKLWLMPFVQANRTTLAFERGSRLAKAGASFHELAKAIMQDAADHGDEQCAMYLVKNAVLTGKARNDVCAKNEKSKSLSHAKAVALLAIQKYQMAEAVLRAAAEAGDVDCAMLLIRQTLRAKIRKVS